MQMKIRSLLFIVIIWFLFLGGVVQAQQEKGREDRLGTGQSPPENDSFIGGKEHYLPDSPFYMAGKRHYLQSDSSSNSGKIEQGNEKNPGPKDEKTPDLAKPDQNSSWPLRVQIREWTKPKLEWWEKSEEEGRISPPPSQPCPGCPNWVIYFSPLEGATGNKY